MTKPDFTPQQWRVAVLVGRGHTNREAADLLNITEGVVRKEHLTAIYAKIGKSDRVVLVRLLGLWRRPRPGDLEQAARINRLSPRQQAAAALVADGLSDLEIAAALRIAPATVKTQLQEARKRLGVGSRARIAYLWLVWQHAQIDERNAA